MNQRPNTNGLPRLKVSESFPLVALTLVVGGQTYAVISPLLRYSIMALGLGVLTLYVLFHYRLLMAHRQYLRGLLFMVIGGEVFNLINAAFPFDLRWAAFRLICYHFLLGGMIFGLRQRYVGFDEISRWNRIPIFVAWAVVSGAVFVYWRNVRAILAFTASSRFGGEDLHPVGIAFGYGTCMIVAAAFSIYDRNLRFRLINAVMLVILGFGIMLTGSRGALLSFVSAAFILVLCKMKYLSIARRVLFFTLTILLFASVVSWLSFSQFAQEQAQFYLGRIEGLGSGLDNAANARLVTWQNYAERFSSWVLLGYRGYAGPYPHNFFYECWLRFGLIGLGASLFVFWLVVRSLLLLWRQQLHPLACVMISVLLFAFLNAQTNLALEFNRTLWLGIGFAVSFVMVRSSSFRGRPIGQGLPPRGSKGNRAER